MGKIAFGVDPSGLVLFGPIFCAEFNIAPNTYFATYFRYSALGLLYRYIESAHYKDKVSFSSMAVGGGIKYFFKKSRSSNRFYLGSFAEYARGGTRGDLDTIWEWEGKDAQINVVLNFGHRWRRRSNFFYNVGVIVGTSIGIKNDWWYIDSPSNVFEDPKKVHFGGLLELSLGWEW